MVQAQTPPLVFSTRKYRWTLPGRLRLGKILQVSLQHNRQLNKARDVKEGELNWRPDGLRSLSRAVGLSHVSLGHLAQGSIARQNDEILRAIAPYCYKVIRFEIEKKDIVGVVLDYTQTYADEWEVLAAIGQDGEAYDSEVVTPADMSADAAAELLKTLESLYRFVPLLRALAARGKNDPVHVRVKQGHFMTEQDGTKELSRSFRAAVGAQGLAMPETLAEDDEATGVISRLFKLVPESVVALYNGDRLPSVYEVEAMLDHLCNEAGEPYTLAELMDIIDPVLGNDRANSKRTRFY